MHSHSVPFFVKLLVARTLPARSFVHRVMAYFFWKHHKVLSTEGVRNGDGHFTVCAQAPSGDIVPPSRMSSQHVRVKWDYQNQFRV